MERAATLALLERSQVVHLASTGPGGAPILRTVHGVVVRGALAFHGAPAGEKTETVGREAVVSAEEIVASIPSHFIDPERACPATTLYRSAQVHGPIERVDAPDEKAEVLAALMRKYQPEGGYVAISSASHPLYVKAIAGIMVLRVSLDRLDGKHKLAQNRSAGERVRLMEKLWERGAPGDTRAIELIREANPDTPLPGFLSGPAGTTLTAALAPSEAISAARLLAGAYWTEGLTEEETARAHLGSAAWVGARDASGALVGTARATGDGARCAWVYDVMVAPALRGRGVGEALMRLLLDHPALRGARRVYLRTRDAQPFYEKLGFGERSALELAAQPPSTSDMVRVRPHGGQRERQESGAV